MVCTDEQGIGEGKDLVENLPRPAVVGREG